MISKEPARSGHLVLRQDGKYLDSSIDPVKGAEKWAMAAKARLGNAPSAIILGLATGYHVVALKRLCPDLKIVVVERHTAVSTNALEVQSELASVQIVVEDDWSRLVVSETLRTTTKQLFRVVKYSPSIQGDELYYQRAEAMILGRDRLGFFLQMRERSDFLRTLDMDKLEAIPTGTPISIKTVLDCQKPAVQEQHEREALLWRALGELVK